MNTTILDYPRNQTLHQLFEAQVERTPDAVAAIFESERLTYRELNRRANQLANRLQRHGVGPEVLVGLCVERSLDMLVGLLAILKAGGAYVPLDPGYPKERLAFMLRDARVPVLVTQERLVHALPEHRAQVVCLDVDASELAPTSIENPSSGTPADGLAYVIYTSGSSGQPKGVLGIHRAVVARLSWIWWAEPFAPDEVACSRTPASFVDSVREIFAPLLKGVPVVIVPSHLLGQPRGLLETLADHGVTRISLIPSLLGLILDTCADPEARAPRLRRWVISGEAPSPELVRRFQQSLPRSTLLNRYGATEGSATWYDVTNHPATTPVPMGRPFANAEVLLLDERMQPVPVGSPGEIYLGGDDLARGYLNRPELTAEKFVPHPRSEVPGARLYRTGDRGRHRPDGELEYLGRIDRQVQLRGVRVELGEIEAALRLHPGVGDVAVVMHERASGERRLVAHFAPREALHPTARELRRFLEDRLPGQMLPQAFVALSALPLLPNGKADLHALREPDVERAVPFVAPRTPIETRVAAMWAEMLDVGSVGLADTFVELGGDSLLATRLVTEIRDRFQLDVPSAALLAAGTVEEMALIVTAAFAANMTPADRARLLDGERDS